MKSMLTFVLLVSITIIAQVPLQKCAPDLIENVYGKSASDSIPVWIIFTDKGQNISNALQKASLVVSEKSMQRREKVLPLSKLIDQTDLPVNKDYIAQLEIRGVKVKQISRWFNGVSAVIKIGQLNELMNLAFVKNIDRVYSFAKSKEPRVNSDLGKNPGIQNNNESNVYNYGLSLKQLSMLKVPTLHNLGFSGQGVTVAVLDAGFNNLSHEVFAKMHIIATYDFVNHRTYVGDGNGGMGSGSHGTSTLSVIGGFKPGYLIGPAFDANYILAKTENTDSETPIEEDNWIAGIEWADSIGVDVTSTSLGYIGFDAPYTSYTWQSMNGRTCKISIAATMAARKGIFVVNAAGNEGYDPSHNTLGAPADADSIVSVGAVDTNGVRVSFSSVGNTIDGRIKPDVMALGSLVRVAGTTAASYYYSSGTSFSCPLVAGVAAVILSAHPLWTPMQLRNALRVTASNVASPNREMGWGIVDALSALQIKQAPIIAFTVPANLATGVPLTQKVTAAFSDTMNSATITPATFSLMQGIEKVAGFVSCAGGIATFAPAIKLLPNTLYRATITTGAKDLSDSSLVRDTTWVFTTGPISLPVESLMVSDKYYSLLQNYPNPFNPETKIKFVMIQDASIDISIYTITGEKIATLFNGNSSKGIHTLLFNLDRFSSGVYFCRMSVFDPGGNIIFNDSKKLTHIK